MQITLLQQQTAKTPSAPMVLYKHGVIVLQKVGWLQGIHWNTKQLSTLSFPKVKGKLQMYKSTIVPSIQIMLDAPNDYVKSFC